MRYLVSTGLYDERGIQINSGFKRLSFLSNLDLRLTPKVNAFTRLNLAYNKQQAISGTNIQGSTSTLRKRLRSTQAVALSLSSSPYRRSVMYVPATGCSTPVSPSVSTTAPSLG